MKEEIYVEMLAALDVTKSLAITLILANFQLVKCSQRIDIIKAEHLQINRLKVDREIIF